LKPVLANSSHHVPGRWSFKHPLAGAFFLPVSVIALVERMKYTIKAKINCAKKNQQYNYLFLTGAILGLLL